MISCERCWSIIPEEKSRVEEFYMSCPRCFAIITLKPADAIFGPLSVDQENCFECGWLKDLDKKCENPECPRSA